MPIYEYRCDSCGHELEVIQKISDAPLVTCPVCECDALKKRVSAAGFRLKGSGWYETDFKSGKKKNVSGEGGGGSGSDGAGGSTGAESGGAAKSETKSESKNTDSGGKGTSPSGGKSEAS